MGKSNIWRRILRVLSIITILTGIIFFVIVSKIVGITPKIGYSIPISIFISLLVYFASEINLKRRLNKQFSLLVIIFFYLIYSFAEVLNFI